MGRCGILSGDTAFGIPIQERNSASLAEMHQLAGTVAMPARARALLRQTWARTGLTAQTTMTDSDARAVG